MLFEISQEEKPEEKKSEGGFRFSQICLTIKQSLSTCLRVSRLRLQSGQRPVGCVRVLWSFFIVGSPLIQACQRKNFSLG